MAAHYKYVRIENISAWNIKTDIYVVAALRQINARQKLPFHLRNYRGFFYFNFVRYRDAIGAVHKYYDVNRNIEKCINGHIIKYIYNSVKYIYIDTMYRILS